MCVFRSRYEIFVGPSLGGGAIAHSPPVDPPLLKTSFRDVGIDILTKEIFKAL